ncbi:ferric reductase-like transmembrane domain-containing protein [Niveibacterium umoris]|uniref:Putative ferric reductase n=1 Tax=Niveibacterium umoris TaxID=1193620 RepID=A0A840BM38_9RHOO|nr:ferric reductase-like transmembrane domain-containing protein [Niveibacterium umoris]MBB4013703.1 putative ferric reductase [Niveibacterium umoris]
MKRIVSGLGALALGVWALTPGAGGLVDGAGFWQWRREAVLLSGLVGLLAMSAAILLATRPRWLERPLGGLDKAYALHKWLGITAGVALGLHWFAENGARWLVQLGWVMRRARGGPHGPDSALIDFAKESGEWAFYVMLALLVVALVQRIPYRYFRWVHKALAVVFLFGTFHALMLAPDAWYAGAAGWLVIAAATVGGVGALWSLTGRIGRARTLHGRVAAVTVHGGGLVDLRLELPAPGLIAKAGQFAFLQFDAREGPHPFTIASADDPCRPRFVIKPLGDYTATLGRSLAAGRMAKVEGPYGCFDFDAAGERELWIAGGIGITPFLARLDALIAQGGSRRPVDFWYCTRNAGDAAFPDGLEARCAKAGVRLHRVVAELDGLLDAARLAREAGTLRGGQVWFCGPAGFARSLRRQLEGLGLPRQAFHSERFAMR